MFQYKRDIRRARMGMFSRKLNELGYHPCNQSLEIVYSLDNSTLS